MDIDPHIVLYLDHQNNFDLQDKVVHINLCYYLHIIRQYNQLEQFHNEVFHVYFPKYLPHIMLHKYVQLSEYTKSPHL
jgi:hypothetical protein